LLTDAFLVQVTDSPLKPFVAAVAGGGVVKAIAVPRGDRLSNSALKPKGDVYEQAVAAGADGILFARVTVDGAGAVSLDAAKAVRECFAGKEQHLVRGRVALSISCVLTKLQMKFRFARAVQMTATS